MDDLLQKQRINNFVQCKHQTFIHQNEYVRWSQFTWCPCNGHVSARQNSNMMIDMQKGDLSRSLSKHKKYGVKQIEQLHQQITVCHLCRSYTAKTVCKVQFFTHEIHFFTRICDDCVDTLEKNRTFAFFIYSLRPH